MIRVRERRKSLRKSTYLGILKQCYCTIATSEAHFGPPRRASLRTAPSPAMFNLGANPVPNRNPYLPEIPATVIDLCGRMQSRSRAPRSEPPGCNKPAARWLAHPSNLQRSTHAPPPPRNSTAAVSGGGAAHSELWRNSYVHSVWNH